MYWGCWKGAMYVVIHLLDDGVVLPIRIIFCNVYYFPSEVVCGEVFFPLFLEFLWKIALLFSNVVW